jgi:hopanoid biosynthesis associated protein HpnK
MPRFLIITADDFGLDPAVNEAVQQASGAGVLSAASLMTAAPAAAEAVRLAHGLPGLRVGLHLVLADGWAVLPRRQIPDLVDQDGRFRDRMALDGLRFFALPRVRRQLAAEIRAQFDAFARTGLTLDHVNAHKHFHLHPTVLGMMLDIGREFGVSAVRVPQEPAWFARSVGSTAGAIALLPWLALMKKRLRDRGVGFNDQVFGIACSGALDEHTLLHILSRLPAGITEIYLHPATATQQPITQSMVNYRHADELHALLSPDVRAAITATGALCGGYRDIKQSMASAAARCLP